jgi:hypothetical protein
MSQKVLIQFFFYNFILFGKNYHEKKIHNTKNLEFRFKFTLIN